MSKEDIIHAWVWIRKNNQSIPDEVLDLMKDAAIEKLAGTQYAGKEWISVEDDMPDYDEYVLWLFENGNCLWQCLDKDGNDWLYGGEVEGFVMSPAKYWMKITIPDQPIKSKNL